MKQKITILALLLCTYYVQAQIIPLKENYKIENATIIVEGKIINEYSYKTTNSIYTDFTLEVYHVLKGAVNTNSITIKSIGGTVGDEKLITCPSNNFKNNNIGVYYLKSTSSQSIYEATYFGQSEIRLNTKLTEEQVLEAKQDLSFLKTISNNQINNTLESNRQITASITTISPTIVNGGTGDTITITGTGFGATGPTSGMKVWTKYADDLTSMVSHANGYNYISWSDTQIVFRVPSTAGTGVIWVGSGSNHATSSQVLRVASNVLDQKTADNTAIYPVNLPAQQGQGITFIPNTNFTDVDAINRTKEAMEQWLCETSVDISLDTTTSTGSTHANNDGLSVIYFDASMGSSTLGVTLTSIAACSYSGRWYVIDVDLAINANTNFNFTLASTPSTQIDYYTVVLHELGHVRNLGHVLNANHIMYPSLSAGQETRTLHSNDIIGGNLVQSDSNTNQVCGQSLMVDESCSTLSVETTTMDSTKIYPNPVSDKILISSFDTEISTYKIFDILGRIVLVGDFLEENEIYVDSLTNGMYILQLTTEEDTQIIRKFIKK